VPFVYDQRHSDTEGELRGILEALKRHTEGDKKYFELGINLFELSQEAPDIFKRASIEKKRQLLTLMFKEIRVENGALAVVFTDVFYTLSLLSQQINGSKQPALIESPIKIFELQKSPCIVLQSGDSLPKLPIELAWRDELRKIDWAKMFPYPSVSLQQMNQLLAIVK